MSHAPSATYRNRVTWKWWMAFLALSLLYCATQWGLEAACRRKADRRLHEEFTARRLEDHIRFNYPSHHLIPQMEADLNGGRPLPRQRIDLPIGLFDRVIVDGSAIDPHDAGWLVQIDYSASPNSFWTRIRVLSPPSGSRFLERIGSPEVQHFIEQFRKLILILCASLWTIVIAPALVAGPFRRELGQMASAAAIVALLAWAGDPDRPTLASLPAFNWIFYSALGGLVIGLFAVLYPVRRSQHRADRCVTCNYDLTGNISGTCPECGQPTPAEVRRRRDAALAPLADAIAITGTIWVGEADDGESTIASEDLAPNTPG